MKKKKTNKNESALQLSLDFSLPNLKKKNTIVKANSVNNTKIISIHHFENSSKRELLKHIIHNEKSF